MTNPQPKSVAIYARVSTDRQTAESQLNQLRDFVKRRNWTLYQEFIDKGYTGANTKRPAFNDMMSQAQKKNFDILLVWKLDRLSRSLKDLINTLEELAHFGIDFISYENDLNTSTPQGKLVFQIVGAVAEFEKDIISERVKAGLENARQKGKPLGRKPKSPFLKDRAKTLRTQGHSYRQISKKLNVSHGTLNKWLNEKER